MPTLVALTLKKDTGPEVFWETPDFEEEEEELRSYGASNDEGGLTTWVLDRSLSSSGTDPGSSIMRNNDFDSFDIGEFIWASAHAIPFFNQQPEGILTAEQRI